VLLDEVRRRVHEHLHLEHPHHVEVDGELVQGRGEAEHGRLGRLDALRDGQLTAELAERAVGTVAVRSVPATWMSSPWKAAGA
jgi:hypothetical protein